MSMFDLSRDHDAVWPKCLKPMGEGEGNKETFSDWWGRHERELGHLHPHLCEQWVYRHWLHSDYAFLPLETLTWELISMEGDDILKTVHRNTGGDLDPDWDFCTFTVQPDGWQPATGLALDRGTWDYPLVCLSTPSGIWTLDPDAPDHRRPLPDVRLVIVEGHQRHRYLNALHARSIPPQGPHKVFIISSPLIANHE